MFGLPNFNSKLFSRPFICREVVSRLDRRLPANFSCSHTLEDPCVALAVLVVIHGVISMYAILKLQFRTSICFERQIFPKYCAFHSNAIKLRIFFEKTYFPKKLKTHEKSTLACSLGTMPAASGNRGFLEWFSTFLKIFFPDYLKKLWHSNETHSKTLEIFPKKKKRWKHVKNPRRLQPPVAVDFFWRRFELSTIVF